MSYFFIPNTLSGPDTATNNGLARYNGTTGTSIKDSGILVDDTDNITGAVEISASTSISTPMITSAGSAVSFNNKNIDNAGTITGTTLTDGTTTITDGTITGTTLTDGTTTITDGDITGAVEISASTSISTPMITSAGSAVAFNNKNITNAGTITGTTLTDGTTTITDGDITGAANIGGGTLTINNITSTNAGVNLLTKNIDNVGTITGTTLTDGTTTITDGDITGASNIEGGTITGGSFTDGTATIASGNMSAISFSDGTASLTGGQVVGATNITTGTLTCDFINPGTFAPGSISCNDANLTSVGTITANAFISGAFEAYNGTVEATRIECSTIDSISGGGVSFNTNDINNVRDLSAQTVTTSGALISNGDANIQKNTNSSGPVLYLDNSYFLSGSTDEFSKLSCRFLQGSVDALFPGGSVVFKKIDDYDTEADCSSQIELWPANAGFEEKMFDINTTGSTFYNTVNCPDINNSGNITSATINTTGHITCGNAIITSFMSGGGGSSAIAFSNTPLSFVGPIGCRSVTATSTVQGRDLIALKNITDDGPKIYLKNKYYEANSTNESNEIVAQFYQNGISDYRTGGRIVFTKEGDYNTLADCTSWMDFYPVTGGTEKRALSLRTDQTVIYDILNVYHSASQNLQISETGTTSMKIDHTGGLSINGPDGVAMVFDVLNEQQLEILPKNTNEVEIKTGAGNLELKSTSGVVRSTSDFEVYASSGQNMKFSHTGVSSNVFSYTGGLSIEGVQATFVLDTSSQQLVVKRVASSSVMLESTGHLHIESVGDIISSTVQASTTAGSANVFITSGGSFKRSTSSIKYKKDVRDYDKGIDTVMGLQPKYYKPKEGVDGGDVDYAGLIAEDLYDQGLNEFLTFNSDEHTKDHVEGIGYDRMVALLINSVKELSTKCDAQAAKIAELESRLDSM